MVHRRTTPAEHVFTYPVSQVWVDPDRPEELCNAHPLWSTSWMSPIRFRKKDYGTDPSVSLADAARDELAPVLGFRPTGEVRLLSQIRKWGWLFNPISVFVVWHTDPDVPVGVVTEVTNTPWKERHRYPLELKCHGTEFRSEFPKVLHVSPFLDTDFLYQLRLLDRDDRIALDIDVVRPGQTDPIVHTALRVGRTEPTRKALGRLTWKRPASTRQVSAGIHIQAAHLIRKGVPFVKHPKKKIPQNSKRSA